jgi:hypothetical protein
MRDKRAGEDGCCWVLISGHWRKTFFYLLIFPSSFFQRISVSAKYRQIILWFSCQYVMRTELFGALPCLIYGGRRRCRGDRDGEGDGDSEAVDEAEGYLSLRQIIKRRQKTVPK